MSNFLGKLSLLILPISLSISASDPDKTLKFEDIPFKNSPVYCENDDNIFPVGNDFELINYSAMSSDEGERFILATIKNASSGVRILKEEHIIAILGDCSRLTPVSFEHKFNGRQILTIKLLFGFKKYPVLKVLI